MERNCTYLWHKKEQIYKIIRDVNPDIEVNSLWKQEEELFLFKFESELSRDEVIKIRQRIVEATSYEYGILYVFL